MNNITPATRAARTFRVALFLLAAAALVPSAARALPFWMHLPEQASTYAPEVDNMFHLIMWITGVIFVIVELMLVYFLWRYRYDCLWLGKAREIKKSNKQQAGVWHATHPRGDNRC